jgi:hypothetical protein
MAKLTYSIPSEFSDEDRWFKFFTKKDVGVLVVTGALTIFLYKTTGTLFGKPFIGLLVGGIIMAISLFLSMAKLPDTMYMAGGGQTIASILLKKLLRKKNKMVYVKGYNEWEEE